MASRLEQPGIELPTFLISKLLFIHFLFLVCVLAESEEIQELLRDLGIEVQTMAEVLPIRVMPARILSHVYVRLGKQALFSLQCTAVHVSSY